jgi:hypothetical protein
MPAAEHATNALEQDDGSVEPHRHCEERKRRSNPVSRASRWIASLALAMTKPEPTKSSRALRRIRARKSIPDGKA